MEREMGELLGCFSLNKLNKTILNNNKIKCQSKGLCQARGLCSCRTEFGKAVED